MDVNGFINGITQAVGRREVFYAAPNINLRTAPRTLTIGGLGELRLAPMTENFDGTYVRYEAGPGCKGPAVARYAPCQNIRLPLPPAVPVHLLPNPALMSLYAFLMPVLGLAVGLAVGHGGPMIIAMGLGVVVAVGFLHLEAVDRMADLYDQATSRAMVAMLNDSWRRPAH